ncbi:hypothetical protein BOTBODRAFT_27641 [Botryobasidium botryosum FD-172 SS1]|uniref:Glycosyltransferase 61 catalytic domain-containing protein n=1 Tax=Botryobasidium botryosum (strain FD-172 SS1) TaxID=930990 RepID=A0A067MWV0_BOTB1|nr:hypothetical protein BOTBODRAFT_27641 [Botryobasidium botryosum FD-172 SS1]
MRFFSNFPTRREVALLITLALVFTLLHNARKSASKLDLEEDYYGNSPAATRFSSSSGTSSLGGKFPEIPNSGQSSGQGFLGDTRMEWGTGPVPATTLTAHAPGWTILDRVYIFNGTIYIVTDSPKSFPERRLMISSGYDVRNSKEEVLKREPTDKDLRFVRPAEARRLFGTSATRVDGVSFIVNDPPQFINHYYHFAAELLFGLWRTYSSLEPYIPASGRTGLPPPSRILFPHTPTDKWRDYARMNQYILLSAFPSVALEFQDDWADRATMGRAFVLDRVVLGDRAAAMRSKRFLATGRTAAAAGVLPGSAHWWAPIRKNVIEFVGGDVASKDRPVITYVSRQDWGRRMLIKEDHEGLVRALHRLRDEQGYEVNIVSMDKLTREEQLRLAARTTIMLGVHGNGLTSLLWMQPSPQATVIEFFYPGGFAFDYEYTTRALGMSHYGFWGKEYFTSPNVPPAAYPEGFQGNQIPIDGDAVAALIQQRLSLDEEADD